MRKKLALLGFLMLVSVGMAYTVSASDALKGVALEVFGKTLMKNEVTIDEEVILQYAKLSEDQRAKAVEIALRDPQVQEILETADDYHINVYAIYELGEYEYTYDSERGKGVALILREDAAKVEIKIFKEYDEELGVKIYEVIVDLSAEEVTEIIEHPEVRKPKIYAGIISTDELLDNPSKYHDQVVRVSGTVSDLGLLRGPYFTLDEKLTICYHWDETNIYPTQIKDKTQNGDHVVVTGRFLGDIVYVENIEKVTS